MVRSTNKSPYSDISIELLQNHESNEYSRISVIIPTFNHVRYIEQTIKSVLLQNHPNIELIVIDGGSDDGTVDIIKKYEKFISYWVSEKDRGQTHAINKGMERATGAILAYLNSDDIYLPGALIAVAEFAKQNPDVDLIYGGCRLIDQEGNRIGERWGNISTLSEIINLWGVWWKKRNYVQPEVFWTRRIAHKVGRFREDLYFVMDYEFWLRIFLASGKAGKIDKELAAFRITPEQKSRQSANVVVELLKVIEPVLWDSRLPITAYQRRQLQSRWLYQCCFLPEVDKSVAAGEKIFTRWLRLLGVIVRHPGMLAFAALRSRMISGLRRLKPGP